MDRRTAPTAADPALARDAAELYEALNDLVRIYQFRDRTKICCHDISVTQCYALDAVRRRGALTLNALAAELRLDKSTASRVVDALERKGYLERGLHPDDARAVRLTLTASGRDLHRRIERELIEEEMRLLSDLDPDIRQATIRLIARLARAAKERIAGGVACRPSGEAGDE